MIRSPASHVTWHGQYFTPDQLRETIKESPLDIHRKNSAAKRRNGLVHYSTSTTPIFGPAPSAEKVARSQGGSALQLVDAQSKHDYRLTRMKTGTLTAARLCEETIRRGGFRVRAWFVTLTYRPGESWSPRHVRGFLDCMRQWVKRNGPKGTKLRYCWTAELQDRGAVHYHLIFWLPKRLSMPKPDKRKWWAHGSSNRVLVEKNAVGYIASYLSKGDASPGGPQFPKGCRICGAGGFDAEARREARYWKAPREAREALGKDADIRRTLGGRFNARTGEFWQSDWKMVGIFGKPHLVRFPPIEKNPCPF